MDRLKVFIDILRVGIRLMSSFHSFDTMSPGISNLNRLPYQLYAKVKEKMEEMQKHNMSWIEVQFLKKAVDVLCLCRQTLMFTYVFAFYLQKNNQSIIFEVQYNASVNMAYLLMSESMSSERADLTILPRYCNSALVGLPSLYELSLLPVM